MRGGGQRGGGPGRLCAHACTPHLAAHCDVILKASQLTSCKSGHGLAQNRRARSQVLVGSGAGERSMQSERAKSCDGRRAVRQVWKGALSPGCVVRTHARISGQQGAAAHRRLSSSLAACCLAASSAEMYVASSAAFLLSSTLASISFWSGSGT